MVDDGGFILGSRQLDRQRSLPGVIPLLIAIGSAIVPSGTISLVLPRTFGDTSLTSICLGPYFSRDRNATLAGKGPALRKVCEAAFRAFSALNRCVLFSERDIPRVLQILF